ncbi:MAG: DMT family transporter [Rhodospirillales bacterium]|jgi:drug/metabolite transporter (DMT)-like permease|nr:DMT family transporter [Rhodospirillales bacterium]
MTDNLRGALWIVIAAFCAAGMTLSVRALGTDFSTAQTIFVRCAIGLSLVFIFSAKKRSIQIFSPQWKWLLVRSLMTFVALFCGFYSISVLPLALVTVLFFTAPLWVTVLAVPFFGETIGWRRALATLAGFAGTLVVLRPGVTEFDPVMLLALASSLLFAGVLLIGKKLSKTDSISTMMFYGMLVAGIGSMPFAVSAWQTPSWAEWLLMFSIAGFGTLRGFGDTKGYAIGEASVMAPFQYTRLVIVSIAAYLIFAEVPDIYTIIGGSIIILSSLYIAHRETKRPTKLGRIAAP